MSPASTAAARAGTSLETLPGLAAREMAAGVRNGSIDPVALLSAHLDRIARFDERVGAFTAVRESALEEARELSRRADLALLPLAGVPVAIKENVDVAGLPTTHGSRATSRAPSARDDELVRRLRRAGCVVVGKTRMPELAIWPFTEGDDGVCRNPRNLQRTPGGSSGGSAAAVAAGFAALGLASDGGGSIRIPAACCGLVGVKPTPGLVPLSGGVQSHWYGCSVFGPLARSVDDAGLMLDALAGTTRYAEPRAQRSPLRVSVSVRHPLAGSPVSSEVRAAVDVVADVLRAAGHHVATEHPPYPLLPDSFMRCFFGGVADDADAFDVDLAKVERRTGALIDIGQRLRRRGLVHQAEEYAAARRLRSWMGDRDLLLTAVLAGPAPRVGRWRDRGWLTTSLGVGRWMGFCPPWNLAGCPALTLPVTRDRHRLPVAVQLVAPPHTEVRLLTVARRLEEALQFRP